MALGLRDSCTHLGMVKGAKRSGNERRQKKKGPFYALAMGPRKDFYGAVDGSRRSRIAVYAGPDRNFFPAGKKQAKINLPALMLRVEASLILGDPEYCDRIESVIQAGANIILLEDSSSSGGGKK